MSDKKYENLIALVGAQQEHLFKTLGKPSRVINSIMFYKGKGGTLAIVLHSPDGQESVVKGVALFSTEGEVLYVYGLELLDGEIITKAKAAKTFDEAQKILGAPVADIGSGRQILAYFTAQAQLLTLQRAGKENAKITTVQLTGEEAQI